MRREKEVAWWQCIRYRTKMNAEYIEERVVYSRKSRKNLILSSPMQLPIHGQWWSKRSTQVLHTLQWWTRSILGASQDKQKAVCVGELRNGGASASTGA